MKLDRVWRAAELADDRVEEPYARHHAAALEQKVARSCTRRSAGLHVGRSRSRHSCLKKRIRRSSAPGVRELDDHPVARRAGVADDQMDVQIVLEVIGVEQGAYARGLRFCFEPGRRVTDRRVARKRAQACDRRRSGLQVHLRNA